MLLNEVTFVEDEVGLDLGDEEALSGDAGTV
jgi:hypothetical protein